MKKFLGIVLLSLLWCNVVFAGCTDDLDASFEWLALDMRTVNKDDHPAYAYFTWKNKTDKKIRITRIFLETADGKTVVERKLENFFVYPYRTNDIWIEKENIISLNLDVVDSPAYECNYNDKWIETEDEKKTKSSGVKGFLKKLLGNN
tara:strand:+ start:600 stop:1043 length:444 start_codon:yes stop_codon:yes gene_type:complete